MVEPGEIRLVAHYHSALNPSLLTAMLSMWPSTSRAMIRFRSVIVPPGMASTSDVADALGSSYETAYKKLRALEDSDEIQSRKVANARL